MQTKWKIVIAVVVVLVAAPIVSAAILVTPFAGMVFEIEDLNKTPTAGADVFMDYPESIAFMEKYPGYSSELNDLGMDYEFWLLNGDNTLRIDYNKETGESYIMYMCANSEGVMDSYDGDNMIDKIATMC